MLFDWLAVGQIIPINRPARCQPWLTSRNGGGYCHATILGMFQEIIDAAQQSDYDFRLSACPDDQFRYLFDEWVSYYRGKWAIARYLQPKRILEIGVRYGYSAFAFLNACPSAQYTGIDLDADLYGGTQGAIDWARDHTRQHHTEFIIADSQKFDRFPGGDYDLIHIDGQQDQQGFLHDLEVAIGQARYILVDGYFWTSSSSVTRTSSNSLA